MNTGGELRLEVGRAYLLFLREGVRGWEPTSGHTFPHMSAYALERPVERNR